MKRFIWMSLMLAAVIGFSAGHVLARGGGHGGGGHHGGGHHGGHHSGHHAHQGNHHHAGHHNNHHYHHSHWAHHNRPFSRGWYGRHGGRWGYGWGGWGWGNPWGVAGFGAAAAWLGLEGAEPILGNYAAPTYYTSDNDDAPEASDQADNDGDDNDGDDDDATNDEPQNLQSPQPPAAEEAATTPAETAAQIAAAEALAKAGQVDPPKDMKFLPLGVFTLAPSNQAEATAIVQLAISKDGFVRGTYYDLLADHDHPLRGKIDKKTQQVAFTFGPQGKVIFDTSLANLTRAAGGVAVHYENGTNATWTLARYEKEPSETETGDQDGESQETPAKVEPAQQPAQPAAR